MADEINLVVDSGEEGSIDITLMTSEEYAAEQVGTKADKTDTVLETTLSMGRKAGTTVGTHSTALGDNVEASGANSMAEGQNTKATNVASHAEGQNTTASGGGAHAEGRSTTASGNWSHAEGYETSAVGGGAHAGGYNSTAQDTGSFAHGDHVVSGGAFETVIGAYNANETQYAAWASGTSYSVGDIVSRNGDAYRCVTANSDSTWTESKWEILPWNTKEAFVIGNGTGLFDTSNALEVYWNGDVHAAGEVYANGKQLAHAEDVDRYGTCSTPADTAQKEVTISGISELTAGLTIRVKFDNENTVTNPTLKLNSFAAAAIHRSETVAGGSSALSWLAGSVVALTYDGSKWIINNYNNTTYSSMTVAEAQNGTGTGGRVITPARLKMAIQYHGIAQPETAGTAGQVLGLDSNLSPVWVGQQSVDISSKADKSNTVLDNTLSMGRKANTTVGTNSTALGNNVEASGNYSHAEGYSNSATGIASHAEGDTNIASGNASHAEGTHNRAVGENSHAGGYYGYANTEGSFAHGMYVYTNGKYETVFGVNNADGGTSFPAWVAGTEYKYGDQVMYNNVVYECNTYNVDSAFDSSKWDECPWTKKEAFVIGGGKNGYDQKNAFEVYWDGTVNAAKDINFANAISGFRKENTTVGEFSAAFGEECEASGSGSFATGWETTASKSNAFAEGNSTTASGLSSHAEGGYTTASGENSHAEGYNTTASGRASHAGGTSTTASGEASFANGYWTKANGDNTAAFGAYNKDLTTYPAWESGKEYNVGDVVTIVNTGAIKGYRCNTQNSDTSFTARKWDSIIRTTEEAFVVGNGEASNEKSNAFEVDWDGTVKASGEMYANGKQLAHAEDISGKADKSNTVLDNTLSMGRKANTTVGTRSTALGNNVEASGSASLAEGYQSQATGIYSHAEGYYATASGRASHAGGNTSKATAESAFAHGFNAEASGSYTVAFGTQNVAMTSYPTWVAGTHYYVGDIIRRETTGEPYRCKTENSDGTFMLSKWETVPWTTEQAFVIGNGESSNSKSNAFEVRWDGSAKVGGEVYAKGNLPVAENINGLNAGLSYNALGLNIVNCADGVGELTCNGLTIKKNNGVITINGTTTGDMYIKFSGVMDNTDTYDFKTVWEEEDLKVIPDRSYSFLCYIFGGTCSAANTSVYVFYGQNAYTTSTKITETAGQGGGTIHGLSASSVFTATDSNCNFTCMRLHSGVTFNNLTFALGLLDITSFDALLRLSPTIQSLVGGT